MTPTVALIPHCSIFIQRFEHLRKNAETWNRNETDIQGNKERSTASTARRSKGRRLEWKRSVHIRRGSSQESPPPPPPHTGTFPLKVSPSQCDPPGFLVQMATKGHVTQMHIFFKWISHQLSWMSTLFLISYFKHLSTLHVISFTNEQGFPWTGLLSYHGYVTGACGYQWKHSQA